MEGFHLFSNECAVNTLIELKCSLMCPWINKCFSYIEPTVLWANCHRTETLWYWSNLDKIMYMLSKPSACFNLRLKGLINLFSYYCIVGTTSREKGCLPFVCWALYIHSAPQQFFVSFQNKINAAHSFTLNSELFMHNI